MTQHGTKGNKALVRWPLWMLLAVLTCLTGFHKAHASSYTQGVKKVLFIKVDFPDKQGDPITDSAAKALIQTTFDFYKNCSYNTTSLSGVDVTPLLRMSQNKAVYEADAGLLLSEARSLATAAGFNYRNYDFHVLGFATIGFGWAGLGYVGAPGTWLNGYFGFRESGHEIGHNLGLWHANFFQTNDGTPNGNGSRQEYGDPFDTMGASGGDINKHFNTWFKNRIDWLPNAGVANVTSSGVYRVEEHDNPAAAGIRAIKIAQSPQKNYWVEFRQKLTGNPWLMNGASIRWGYNVSDGSDLLDMTPRSIAGGGDTQDSALVIGRTFSDTNARVHITPIRKVGSVPEQLEFVVNLGDFPGNNAPTITLTASTTTAAVGQTVLLSATSKDPDGDTLAYSWEFGDTSFGTNAPTAQKSWASNGDYTVRCTVSDMKGGTSSASVVIRVGSVNSFRISGKVLTTCGSPVEGATVQVSATKLTTTDSLGNYTLTGLTPADYTVTATLGATALNPANFTNPVTVGPDKDSIDFGAIGGADSTPPTLSIDSPSDGAIVGNLASQGTAADNAGGCGIDRLDMAIQRESDGKHWSGTTWVDGEPHLSLTLNGNAWSKTAGLPGNKDLSAGNYTIEVNAFDGNLNTSSKEVSVNVPSPPLVSVTTPAPGSQIKNLTLVAGKASDPDGRSLGVKVSLHRLNDNKYFDGGLWITPNPGVAAPSFAATYNSATGSWSATNGLPANSSLLSGTYRVIATATNSIGRSSTASSAFTIDREGPLVSFTKPLPNGSTNSLATVTGTAIDNAGGIGASGVARVDFSLKRNSDNKYWNGTAWVTTASILGTVLSEQQFTNAVGTNWSAPASGARLPSASETGAGSFTLTAKATDRVGNTGTATTIVNIDAVAPRVVIKSPINGTVVTTLRTTGTATDNTGGSGVERVGLTMRRASDGKYWNGTAWVDAQPVKGVEYPGAELLVGSYNTGLIREFNATTGAGVQDFATAIRNPESIAFGNDLTGDGFPELFVAERSQNRVIFYDGATRKKLGVYATGGGLQTPTGLAFMPNGDLLIANGHSNNTTNFPTAVKRFDGRTRAYLGDFVLANSGGVTNGFEGMCFGNDADGDGVADLYIAALFDHRIPVYSGVDGSYIRDLATTGSGGLQFPTDVTFGPDANGDGAADAYVCSSATDDIKLYDGVSGAFLRDFVADNNGAKFALNGPERALFGPDGNLYVSSFGQAGANAGSGSAVLRFNGKTGAPLPAPGQTGAMFASGGINGPAGLAFNAVATGDFTAPPAPPTTLVPPVLTTGLDTTTGSFARGAQLPTGANLLPDTYTLTATAVDRAGNSGSATSVVRVGSVPIVTITTPANNSVISTLPKAEGTAQGDGIVLVQLYLSRQSDGLYWTGTAWGTRTALSTTLSALSGVTGMKFQRTSGLPSGANLSAGTYNVEAIATNNIGLKGSAISGFTVQTSGGGSGGSDVTLSQITATTSTSTIKLGFTGALDLATATDPSRYTITINGVAVGATQAIYSASNASVLLKVPTTALHAGDTVRVSFNLLDSAGRTVIGQSDPVVAIR